MRHQLTTAAITFGMLGGFALAQTPATQPADNAAEIAQLRAEVAALRAQNAALKGDVVAATQATAQAEEKAAIASQPPPPPAPTPYGRTPLDRSPRGAMTHVSPPDK